MRQTKRFANLLITLLLLLTTAAPPLQQDRAVLAGNIKSTSRGMVSNQPGLQISGYVLLENGQGLPDVAIYQAFAAYWPGAGVATTGPDGFYQSTFADIPGDETITVHAKRACYTFSPEYVTWRHYYGHEVKEINFTAYPAPCLHFYMPLLQCSAGT